MTHAWTTPTDPIQAAIERHRAAYDAFQIAPEGEAALIASDDYDAATQALVSTPCATRFGSLALVGHLRWWLVSSTSSWSCTSRSLAPTARRCSTARASPLLSRASGGPP